MWSESPRDNSPAKLQCINLRNYSSKYGIQHKTSAHSEKQAITGCKITGVNQFNQENQRSNLY